MLRCRYRISRIRTNHEEKGYPLRYLLSTNLTEAPYFDFLAGFFLPEQAFADVFFAAIVTSSGIRNLEPVSVSGSLIKELDVKHLRFRVRSQGYPFR